MTPYDCEHAAAARGAQWRRRRRRWRGGRWRWSATSSSEEEGKGTRQPAHAGRIRRGVRRRRRTRSEGLHVEFDDRTHAAKRVNGLPRVRKRRKLPESPMVHIGWPLHVRMVRTSRGGAAQSSFATKARHCQTEGWRDERCSSDDVLVVGPGRFRTV